LFSVAPALADNAPAAASAAPSPYTFTGNMTIATNYVFRGLTQTNGKPAIQGGFDYAHSSGFYAGTWLSNISWFTDQNAGVKNNATSLASPGAVGAPYTPNGSNDASLEWDVYGGYKNSFAGGDWNYDVGVLTYNYPGTYDNLGVSAHPYRKPNTAEVYGALGYKWLTLKYSKSVSQYTFGVNESKGADYLDLSASIPLGDTGATLLAHVGHQRYPNKTNNDYFVGTGNNSFFSYTDYKLGVSKDFVGCIFALAATHTNTRDTASDGNTTVYMNAFGKNIGKNTVIASVTKTF
jgi:uncharacterized protein (TIGR02001 family)